MMVKFRVIIIFLLIPTSLFAKGLSFSNSYAPDVAEVEVRSESGVTCKVPARNGSHFDLGAYSEFSPESDYTPGPSSLTHGVFARLVIPLGLNKMAKLNCKEILDLEIKKLRLEYRLLLEKINEIKEE